MSFCFQFLWNCWSCLPFPLFAQQRPLLELTLTDGLQMAFQWGFFACNKYSKIFVLQRLSIISLFIISLFVLTCSDCCVSSNGTLVNILWRSILSNLSWDLAAMPEQLLVASLPPPLSLCTALFPDLATFSVMVQFYFRFRLIEMCRSLDCLSTGVPLHDSRRWAYERYPHTRCCGHHGIGQW